MSMLITSLNLSNKRGGASPCACKHFSTSPKKNVLKACFFIITFYCNITSWFAIELAEIRSRRILRGKAGCKQFRIGVDTIPESFSCRREKVCGIV